MKFIAVVDKAVFRIYKYIIYLKIRNMITTCRNYLPTCSFNHLGPHDAAKHHFTSPKTGLIFLHK